jgi:hypothetical protein
MPSQTSPSAIFFTTFLALYNNVEAILKALARPPQLISKITSIRREAERNYSSLSRSSRWPLGLLDDTRQRMNEEREEKARRSEVEAENLSKELRYTQQTVASELAGWREMHERLGRKAIRELARGMLITERMRLDGMRRALRKIRDMSPPQVMSMTFTKPFENGCDTTTTTRPPIDEGGPSGSDAPKQRMSSGP